MTIALATRTVDLGDGRVLVQYRLTDTGRWLNLSTHKDHKGANRRLKRLWREYEKTRKTPTHYLTPDYTHGQPDLPTVERSPGP